MHSGGSVRATICASQPPTSDPMVPRGRVRVGASTDSTESGGSTRAPRHHIPAFLFEVPTHQAGSPRRTRALRRMTRTMLRCLPSEPNDATITVSCAWCGTRATPPAPRG